MPKAPRRVGQAAAITTVGALLFALLTQTSLASAGVDGSVSTHPAVGTPQLATTRTPEQIRQLVQCGSTMYAVGTFTKINQGKLNFTRNNVFSFKATAPYTVRSWNPDVSGKVNSITFDGTDCSHAYIGGAFHTVHGSPATDIAEIDTTTGALVSSFGHTANGQVETLRSFKGHILVGGYYTAINGSTTDKYMTSLNAATGKDDGFIHLNISGNYRFPGSRPNPTKVYNQALSHSGTLDLVMGDFTSVGGQKRQQIFMLNLAGAHASLPAGPRPNGTAARGCAASRIQAATRTNVQSTSRSTSRRHRGRRMTRRSTSAQPASSPMGLLPAATPVPACATLRPPSPRVRSRCSTSGSTTPVATRSSRPWRAPPRRISPGTSGGRRTLAAATSPAPERYQHQESRVCRRAADISSTTPPRWRVSVLMTSF